MQQTLSVVVLQAKTMEHSKEPGGIQLSKRFNMPPSTNGKCDRESITTCTVDCDSSHVENSNSASQSATVLLADNPPLVEPISSTLTARDDIQVSNSTVQGIVGAGTFPEARNREEFTFSAKNIPKPSSVSPSVSPMKHDMGPMTTTEFVEIAKPSIQSMLMAGILPQSENTDGQLMPECDTFIGPGLEIPITKHAIGTFSQPEDVDASISSSSTEVTPQLVSALQSDNTWELNTGLVSVNYSSAAKTTAVTMASHTKTMKENDHSAITADGYLTDAFSILEVSPKSTCAFPVSSTPHGSESKNSTNLSKATHHLSQQVEGMKQENGSNKLVTKNSNSSTGASNIILSSQEVLENDCVMTIDSPNCTSSEVVHVTVSAQVKTTEQRDKSPMTVDGIQPSKVTVQSVAAGDIMSPQTKNYVKLDEELLRTNDTSSTCIEDFVSDQQPVCAAGKPPRAESMQKVMVVDDIKTTVQSAVVISTLSQSEDTNDICVTHPPSCIDAYPQDSDAGHGNQSVTLTDDFNSTEFSRIMEAQQPISMLPQIEVKIVENVNTIECSGTTSQSVPMSPLVKHAQHDSRSENLTKTIQPPQPKGTKQNNELLYSTDHSNATTTLMSILPEAKQDIVYGLRKTSDQADTQIADKLKGTDFYKTGTTSGFQFQSSDIIREAELNAYVKRMNINECESGQTPLHLASKHGLLSAVKVLIEEFDFNPNVHDTNYQETPLHYASRFGHAAIVKYFVEHGCDAEIMDMNNLTPLHYASRHGHLDIVTYLSSTARCSLDVKDNQQQTPLHYACHFGYLNIVKFFVKGMDCDPEKRDEEMRTPLHIACKYRHNDIVHYLVHEQKCNPNAADINGRTPLHYACIWWHHIKYDHDKSVSHKVAEALLTDTRCDINKTTRNGDTALHLACKVDRLDIVRHLLSKPSLNPNAMNKHGQTPLQLASHLNVISELIDKGANPILSIMYKWRKCSEADIRRPVLQSWNPEKVRELTQSIKTPHDLFHWVTRNVTEDQATEVILIIIRHTYLNLNLLFRDGYNALHIACKENKPNIAKCLLSQGSCNPNEKTGFGNTPLSLCSRSNLSVAKELLQHHANPTTFLQSLICNLKNKIGYLLESIKYLTENARWEIDIALHLACEANQLEIVQFLLAERKCNPNSLNSAKRTPLQLTSDPEIIKALLRHGANPMDVYRYHRKILGTKQPLCPSVKVFIVGNPAVGKSTLTAALQKEPILKILFIATKVSDVDEKTAGVIPHEFESKMCGRITLYDFAGQREFYGSHAALLCNAIQSSPPIFVLVVKVNEENEIMKKNIIYWLSFIENQCTSVVNKPHVIIVGSHADLVQAQGEDPNEKESIICVAFKEALLSSMEYVGFVPMNCCYSNSPGMRRLRNFMKKSCSTVRSQAISFRVHCFQVYLHDKFCNHIAVQLKSIQKQIKCDINSTSGPNWHGGDQDITFTSFVPSDLNELCKFCKELNDQGHILFLDDLSNTEDSWIIIDKSTLLKEVTGTIFAPASFKEHRDLASSTGVVPLSKIKEHFPNHDPDMLVGYLSHLEFCHEISDISILKLIIDEQQICMSSERYFFFPALVTMEIPKKVWKAKPQQFGYHCGWILQCSKPDRFFTPRFLEVLLLRLAFSFALAKSPDEIDQSFPAIQRECSIWTKGIFWGSRLGPEVLVEEYFNEAVIILMRCEDVHLMKCIECRSKIITTVLQCAKEFCPRVQNQEFFIDPSEVIQYPLIKNSLSELTLFSIQNIANIAISSDRNTDVNLVHTTGSVSLKYLLKLEPYAILSNSVTEILLKEPESNSVSDSLIYEMSECGCANENFIKIFNPRPGLTNSESNLYHALRKWRDESEGTLLRLREKLDQYSIFAGRGSNIFEIARIPPPEKEFCQSGFPCADDNFDHSPVTSSKPAVYEVNPGVPSEFLISRSALKTCKTHPLSLQKDDKPTMEHVLWLKCDSGESLREVRIVDTVAAEWEELAMALGFDGHIINFVKKDFSQDSKGATCKILRMWLEGDYNDLKGPISWLTLLQCLTDIGYSTICEEIQEIFEEPLILQSVDL